jgi:hypothetical protein
MAVKPGAAAAIGIGALFIYAGIKGFSVLKAAQNIIRGTGPEKGQTVRLLAMPGFEGGSGGSFPAGGSPAMIGQSYVGKLRYVFGGPPPPGTVDCSSFANKVLHEAGVKNPGGAAFNPNTHGPNTAWYLVWNGAKTIGHKASDAQINDLCVWQTHMGICIGNGQMVSARSADSNPNVGIDNIEGDMPGEFLFVRRLV